MQAVAGGDLEAFNKLALRYKNPAWKTAYRFVGDVMEAEDLVQETFLKILESAPRYRPTAAFRTYFYRVLIHLCIDRTRKKQPAVDIDEIPESPAPSCDLIDDLIKKECKARIQKALELLPAKQKAAIILRHYEDLSYTQISQVLSITPKAVERLISRARASLQTIFSLGKST